MADSKVTRPNRMTYLAYARRLTVLASRAASVANESLAMDDDPRAVADLIVVRRFTDDIREMLDNMERDAG